MRIIYHHRTRSTDAQRIHIQEIVKAFEALGHEVEVVSLVPIDTCQNDAQRDAGDAWWRKMVRRIPFTYDLVLSAPVDPPYFERPYALLSGRFPIALSRFLHG